MKHVSAFSANAPKSILCFILSLLLASAFYIPAFADNNVAAAGDELGAGFDESTMLDLSFDEACEIAGVDLSTLDSSSTHGDPTSDEITPSSLTPSKYQRLMNYALQYKGWKYVWGGKYPSQGGFDCSGLVTWCYDKALGATMDGWYTNAARIYNDYCDYVPANKAKPGDLVFWRGTYGSDVNYISHVGIYCGGNLCYAAGSPIGYYQIDNLKNIHGGRAEYFFGSLREVDDGNVTNADGILMYRLYNSHTSEHFYTANIPERDWLVRDHGWTYEGVGWIAPEGGKPVYRLYNPGLGDHHYTLDATEKDWLVRTQGWKDEGIGWYSGGSTPIYRQYNGGLKCGQHNYTISKQENDWLCASQGWKAEGIGWYAL